MKPLALSGRATEITAYRELDPDTVLRLCDPKGHVPFGLSDAAILRKPSEVAAATRAGLLTAVVIGTFPVPGDCFATVIRLGDEFDYLGHGDVIGLDTRSRRLRTLYRRASRHNSFLVTERCNHYCLMCSQPPKDADDSWILGRLAKMLPLVSPETRSIAFTGGEPLLNWRPFIDLLTMAREELPTTAVHVLTNGRGFADPEIVSAWAQVRHPNLMAGIPIYSAVDQVHDYVVQSKGAFDETVLGILRLKEARQRIEIRVVLHKITAPRIVETARWLARNLPFVDHVALMGLENTGFALANSEALWIDPIDYRDELALAVDILEAARVPVSVYNLPFCVLDPATWPFARQSISDWKNAYLPQCGECSMRGECAGFFSSGRPRSSRAIEPIREVSGAAEGRRSVVPA